jgi:preflagellin peptidase FlaK
LLSSIAIAKVALCAVALGVASVQDWRTREVDDVIWLVMGCCGAALTISELCMDFSQYRLTVLALSAVLCFALGLGLYYLGFFGGADAKCLWCLGVTLPFNPLEGLSFNSLGPQNPVFSISIFNNSILTAAFLALGIALLNVVRRTRGPLFIGNEERSFLKRLIAVVIGYRVRVSKVLEKRDFYFPLENFVLKEGRVERRFRLSTKITDSDPYEALEKLVREKLVREDEEIWASPAIPLIVNIVLGFFISLLYGDLVLAIIKGLAVIKGVI